ncbi:hypothetical protein [Alkalinema pantanalense]|uniref:hypothetical protein n=1 Tax=Alkalinema pantanalense TaxID=1620705 RepID=UPI003D6E355E
MFWPLFWIISISSSVVIYLVADAYRTRQAIIWWQKQQIERLHQETELIREQMLQDLFSLRRSLGIMITQFPTESKLEPTLDIADRCHTDLADLSDRLFSPYAIENLEAALRELVIRWKRLYPNSSFSYIVEDLLEENCQTNYQFLLLWLDELCQLLLRESQPVSLKLISRREGRYMSLTCSIQANHTQATNSIQSQSANPPLLDQIHYLKQIFIVVQQGRCTLTTQQNQYVFHLQW